VPVLENLNPTWDLDVIFPGGSGSAAYTEHLDLLERDISDLTRRLEATAVPKNPADVEAWSSLLEAMQELGRRLRQGGAFVSCLTAQNVKDDEAKRLSGRLRQLSAAFASANTLLGEQMVQMPEAVFQVLVGLPEWAPVAYPLSERRRRAQEKLPTAQELLINDLSVDGYHGWGELYDTVVGRMAIPWEEDGRTYHLSAGQMSNKLTSADPLVRDRAMQTWESAWAKEAELCATVLNHLSGYRLQLYKHRGWDSILREPLDVNRMTPQTLEVMWDVIERNKAPMVTFLGRKAQLMGKEALAWQDVGASVNGTTRKVSYAEAAAFIIEHFGRFSPRMADFAEHAFRNRWIEVEDRPGKMPDGFCTSFPLSGQSRVFMTFGGTPGNTATLAHELGHAWHHNAMIDLPPLAQGYAMNVAETASTFAEAIVADAAVKTAPSDAERLALVEDKAERAVMFFMNIHARFLFETAFYAERQHGMLSVERLNALMEEAQRRAYQGALSAYHPHFWASKLHFYITGQPFYNFPYTFGFLFSTGIYARALAEGPAFEQKYLALLRDTGRMPVEQLAHRHLGVDLTQPDFWQSAVDVCLGDIAEFLRLTQR